jgi:hypothetical protein
MPVITQSTDPYRNAIKRTLEEKESIKRRKNYLEKNNHQESEAFLDQSVELPESVNNVVGLGMFALLPYIIGVLFIFLIIAQANIETYRKTDMNSFFLAWTIGYEVIATVLLLAIFKSALSFRKK